MNPAGYFPRFSQLSAPRRTLVRLCQATNYGQIHHLEIRDGDPVLSPPPLVLADIKLDSDEEPRRELYLADFSLGGEVCRLMDQLDELKNGTIERIEIREGIPRRIIVKIPLEAFALDPQLTIGTEASGFPGSGRSRDDC